MKQINPLILVINPGSTSTKIAAFKGKRELFSETLDHPAKELRQFDSVAAQLPFRMKAVSGILKKHDLTPSDFDIAIGRGGLLRPVSGGIYKVSKLMLEDLAEARYGEHASNLGAIIANAITKNGKHESLALIADPVVVDELSDIARVTGWPEIKRRSIFHALSQKAVARKVAARLRKPVNRCRFVVAHIGGGVSIGAHCRGLVVDVNNALDGDGPFTPERTGALPLIPFYRYCSANGLSPEQAARQIARLGGLLAHLGTNDCREIVSRIEKGDKHCELILSAFVYQLAKAIGAAATALDGRLDAIILTGNVMKSKWILQRLRRKIAFLAPIHVITDCTEMDALAEAARNAWDGLQQINNYS